MRVSDLIEKLQQCDPNAYVHTTNHKGNWMNMPDLVDIRPWGPEGHQTYVDLEFDA